MGRRTAEADILLVLDNGSRAAVDVKHSQRGVYWSGPSPATLAVVDEAIARREINSFHFVATGRFSRGFAAAVVQRPHVWLHEAAWPGEDLLRQINFVQAQAIATNRVLALPNRSPTVFESQAADAYRGAIPTADLAVLDYGAIRLTADRAVPNAEPRWVTITSVDVQVIP